MGMHVVVVNADKNGKVVLTKEELESMLNDAYEHGKRDGYITYSPTWTSTDHLNIKSPLGCETTYAAINGVKTDG